MSDRLDHGLLNVPLTKRGSIDAQIDVYKAAVARDQKQKDAATYWSVKAQKAQLRAALDRIGDYRVLQLAKPFGCRKPTTAREKLYQVGLSNLSTWLRAFERERFPGGCAACWAPAGECAHSPEEWLGPSTDGEAE